MLDPRPGYHTASALWPLGLCAVVADEAAGAFRSEIVEGAAGSPAFRVTLDPHEGEPVVRSPAPLRLPWQHQLSQPLAMLHAIQAPAM